MSTPKNYAWDAKDYAKNSQNQFQWAQELLPKLKLKGNEALLDVGCGDGKITAEIARCLSAGKAVGIDSSPQMINLAITSFPAEKYPNLLFKLMDARNVSFQEEFDIVFSNAALHWILDQKAVLKGVHNALKPGGRILLQMAGKGNAQAILQLFDEVMARSKWAKYYGDFTFPYAFLNASEYRQLLVQADLKPLRVELFPRDMKFPNAEGLAGWVRTTWLPFTERVPAELRDALVKEIVSRYLALHSTGPDGTIHLAMMRLEVEALKQ